MFPGTSDCTVSVTVHYSGRKEAVGPESVHGGWAAWWGRGKSAVTEKRGYLRSQHKLGENIHNISGTV